VFAKTPERLAGGFSVAQSKSDRVLVEPWPLSPYQTWCTKTGARRRVCGTACILRSRGPSVRGVNDLDTRGKRYAVCAAGKQAGITIFGIVD